MSDLNNRHLFTPFTHPESGVTFHILIDPHPRFVCTDRYVIFTTRVRGEVDVAVVLTEDLVGRTV